MKNNRYYKAVAIDDGAVNPRAILHSMQEAIEEIRVTDPGTDSITQDHAFRLMCHQLAYLCGLAPDMDNYLTARRICEEKQT